MGHVVPEEVLLCCPPPLMLQSCQQQGHHAVGALVITEQPKGASSSTPPTTSGLAPSIVASRPRLVGVVANEGLSEKLGISRALETVQVQGLGSRRGVCWWKKVDIYSIFRCRAHLSQCPVEHHAGQIWGLTGSLMAAWPGFLPPPAPADYSLALCPPDPCPTQAPLETRLWAEGRRQAWPQGQHHRGCGRASGLQGSGETCIFVPEVRLAGWTVQIF